MATHVVTEESVWSSGPIDPSLYQLRFEKGLAGGFAALGEDGRVPASQLPATAGGDLSDYQQIDDKDQPTGYMGLDVDGRGSSPPQAHGADHGIGGAGTLSNGLVVTNSLANSADAVFSLNPRPTLAYPVIKARPEGSSSSYNLAWDLAPKGTPGNNGNNGIVWADLCTADPDVSSNFTAARISSQTGHVEYASRGFGSSNPPPIWIGGAASSSATSSAIIVDPQTTTPSIKLGAESGTVSSVVLGGTAAMATTDTKGFAYLRSVAGTPTGIPTAFGSTVPIVIDTSASKLWAYISGAWKSVALT